MLALSDTPPPEAAEAMPEILLTWVGYDPCIHFFVGSGWKSLCLIRRPVQTTDRTGLTYHAAQEGREAGRRTLGEETEGTGMPASTSVIKARAAEGANNSGSYFGQ